MYSSCGVSAVLGPPARTDKLDICITLPVIYFFFKETTQKSLEEIDLLFGQSAVGVVPEGMEETATSAEDQEKEKESGSAVVVENSTGVG